MSSSQADRIDPEIHWPADYPRTSPQDRESYPGNMSLTRKESFESIVTELERWGATDVRISTASQHYADRPNIPHQYDKPDDVGVVARFRRLEGRADEGYAIACDRWATQLENARAIALYARRKRLAERCGVTTAESEFETARLPPGGDDAVVVAEPVDDRDPHEVLGIASDAPESVVQGAARGLIKELHPDRNGGGGDPAELERVREARDAMLEG